MATGGSTNNAHDAVATMEIIIKPSTCNDLWALSLVRVANNRSATEMFTAGNRPAGPSRCLRSYAVSRWDRDRGRLKCHLKTRRAVCNRELPRENDWIIERLLLRVEL